MGSLSSSATHSNETDGSIAKKRAGSPADPADHHVADVVCPRAAARELGEKHRDRLERHQAASLGVHSYTVIIAFRSLLT
jgi:hypothetical protein